MCQQGQALFCALPEENGLFPQAAISAFSNT